MTTTSKQEIAQAKWHRFKLLFDYSTAHFWIIVLLLLILGSMWLMWDVAWVRLAPHGDGWKGL